MLRYHSYAYEPRNTTSTRAETRRTPTGRVPHLRTGAKMRTEAEFEVRTRTRTACSDAHETDLIMTYDRECGHADVDAQGQKVVNFEFMPVCGRTTTAMGNLHARRGARVGMQAHASASFSCARSCCLRCACARCASWRLLMRACVAASTDASDSKGAPPAASEDSSRISASTS